jgi:hypothetical protein
MNTKQSIEHTDKQLNSPPTPRNPPRLRGFFLRKRPATSKPSGKSAKHSVSLGYHLTYFIEMKLRNHNFEKRRELDGFASDSPDSTDREELPNG